jgi:hypothetical protein
MHAKFATPTTKATADPAAHESSGATRTGSITHRENRASRQRQRGLSHYPTPLPVIPRLRDCPSYHRPKPASKTMHIFHDHHDFNSLDCSLIRAYITYQAVGRLNRIVVATHHVGHRGDHHAGTWTYNRMGNSCRRMSPERHYQLVPAAQGMVGVSQGRSPAGKARSPECMLGSQARSFQTSARGGSSGDGHRSGHPHDGDPAL